MGPWRRTGADLTFDRQAGRSKELMARYRSHSIEFKRQIAQEFLGGETLHGLEKRHDMSRNLVRVWVERYQAGAFDEDAAAGLHQQYEARIASVEQLAGKQALELEFLKGICGTHRRREAHLRITQRRAGLNG